MRLNFLVVMACDANGEALVSEQETVAQLSDGMSEEVRHLPLEQARKRAYAYASVAHEELLARGFHDDRATAIIEAVLEIVFAQFGLGKPD